MDAAAHDTQRPKGVARPGRIIVVRHGKPALDREAGPRLDWRSYRDWWSKYEACPLHPGQSAPEDLVREAKGAPIIFSSERQRSIETAGLIAGGREVKRNAVFNEAPLPPPRWDSHRYLPKTWNKLARLAWMMGHSGEEESAKDTRRRASDATEVLVDAAKSGRDVVLAAHGWFNRMLRPQLARRGWTCVRDGGDAYWSYRIYERRN